VKDSATAEALKPWFGQWCKRPTFNDEYLPTFNRPNVKLVDTSGKGVDRVTEHGVVVNGVEYEVDCLIFATGFEVGTAYTRRAEFGMYGRNGVSLSDAWAKGMRTYHGFLSHGFRTVSIWGSRRPVLRQLHLHARYQAKHVALITESIAQRGIHRADPQAEAEWVKLVTDRT
jgi:cyclohexanone monooxygenase